MLSILFHDDFDGAASAALLMALLVNYGFELGFDFKAVDYGTEALGWERQPYPGILGPDFEGDFAVVDFQYHRGALHFFDHHPTAFRTPEDRAHFDARAGDPAFVRWLPTPSCAQLIFDEMPPEGQDFFRPVCEAANLIDQARYPTADDYFQARRPEIGISHAFHALTPAEKTRVIAHLAKADLEAARTAVQDKVGAAVADSLAALDAVQEHCELRGSVVIQDSVRPGLGMVRFAPFYYHPESRYALTIYPRGADVGVALGKNPWVDFDPLLEGVHLGQIAARVGGGGHPYAAGAQFRQSEWPVPYSAAWRFAADVARELSQAQPAVAAAA